MMENKKGYAQLLVFILVVIALLIVGKYLGWW
jgi:hypothetical protein